MKSALVAGIDCLSTYWKYVKMFPDGVERATYLEIALVLKKLSAERRVLET